MAFRYFSRLDTSNLFESEHLTKDLGRKSVRGGMITMSAQGVRFVLNLLRTMILARLLTKADFGIISMVTVVVGFASMFKDAGLSMATVQKKEINEGQISTLFWCNISLSILIGLCIVVASPLVSILYKQPPLSTLTWVTIALSCSFIFSGLTIQHNALMRRHMMFTQLAYIAVVTQIISLIAAVALAILGWRYWALVGSAIVQAISNMLLVFIYCPWRPKRPAKGTGIRKMLMFGGHLTGFDFVNYFARNGDNLLIGRYLGEDALGIYSRAYSLFMMPITQIRGPIFAVATPTLSSLQNDPERYRHYYCKIVEKLAFFTVPLAGFCIMFADPIISILLGEQWLEAIPIFRLLAVAGLTQSTVSTSGAVMTTLGYSKRYFYVGLFGVSIILLSFCIGLYWWGLMGLVWGYVIASYFNIVPMLHLSFYKTPISLSLFFSAVARSFISTFLAMLITLGVMHILYFDYFVNYSIGSAIYVITCLLPWICIKSWKDEIVIVMKYLKK